MALTEPSKKREESLLVKKFFLFVLWLASGQLVIKTNLCCFVRGPQGASSAFFMLNVEQNLFV